MGKKKRIKKIRKFAKKARDDAIAEKPRLAASLTYRWEHTLRVAQRGMELAKEEGADVEIVTAACLLHDIAKLSNHTHGTRHGRVGARMVKPLLKELGYSKTKEKQIRFAIAFHVDGNAGFKHPNTLEADIVSDADKLDRFSAYRMILALNGKIEDYDAHIKRAQKYLNTLKRLRKKPPLRTKNGRKKFKQDLATQIAFLEKLVADSELTTPPKL